MRRDGSQRLVHVIPPGLLARLVQEDPETAAALLAWLSPRDQHTVLSAAHRWSRWPTWVPVPESSDGLFSDET